MAPSVIIVIDQAGTWPIIFRFMFIVKLLAFLDKVSHVKKVEGRSGRNQEFLNVLSCESSFLQNSCLHLQIGLGSE